jgi:hypothetical protein
VEAALASLTGILFVATLVKRDWIEAVFGVDPDAHSGSLEWVFVGVMVVLTVFFGALARAEWSYVPPVVKNAD